MIPLELLVMATHGQVLVPGRADRFAAFASDSREVMLGDCFVAVRGTHADGHDFVMEAATNGAGAVFVEAARVAGTASTTWDAIGARGTAVIVVPDVRLALRQYAAAVLRLWGPQVIAVAGSAGKTTAKEAIATILSREQSTFRSWRNYNDRLGIPLSLGRLEPHHTVAVLELSCDYPGELAELAAIVRPAIAVILNALPGQFDGLGGIAGVATALAALPAALGSAGTVVLNRDDTRLQAIGEALAKRADHPKIVWFGAEQGDPFMLAIFQGETAQHIHLAIAARSPGEIGPITPLPGWLGMQWADALRAAVTVGAICGISPAVAATSLQDTRPLPGRMRWLVGRAGLHILDDAHSALPHAVSAALVELRRLGTLLMRPTIALLGDMTQLGEVAPQYHAQIGAEAAHHAAILITKGALAEGIARGAREAGMSPDQVIVTHTAEDAAQAVLDQAAHFPAPPIVLIKGSPEMRMEQVTARLLHDPTRVPELLDRQRQIWQRAIVGALDRPTWLEIDLGAIGANCRAIADLVGPHVAIMATLKADAYGHGALKVAHTVLRHGATWLGVATVSEAAPLRAAGITAPILVYGYLPPWQAQRAVQLDLRATLYDRETAIALSHAANALGVTARAHVKIDTGMGRLGLRAEDPSAITAFLRDVSAMPSLEIEGIYTHFATADEDDLAFVSEQLRRFHHVLTLLDRRPPIIHAANSAAALRLPAAHFDMVRPGIALYGISPAPDLPLPADFAPAMAFKTQIALVKTVPAGEGISYGHTYTTTAPERLATLPVGYADGFRRGPTNWGTVLIRGQRAPIRGRVCMDQTIVSVDQIPEARAGDEVVLLGRQGDDAISVEEVAERLGTSAYEVVAALLARVPRVTA